MFKWLFKKKGCAKHMNNKLEVIGIDHGWSMMKTISQLVEIGLFRIDSYFSDEGDVLQHFVDKLGEITKEKDDLASCVRGDFVEIQKLVKEINQEYSLDLEKRIIEIEKSACEKCGLDAGFKSREFIYKDNIVVKDKVHNLPESAQYSISKLMQLYTIFDVNTRIQQEVKMELERKMKTDSIPINNPYIFQLVANVNMKYSNFWIDPWKQITSESEIIKKLDELRTSFINELLKSAEKNEVVISEEFIDSLINQIPSELKKKKAAYSIFYEMDCDDVVINKIYPGYMSFYNRFLRYTDIIEKYRDEIKDFYKVEGENIAEIYETFGFNANSYYPIFDDRLEFDLTRNHAIDENYKEVINIYDTNLVYHDNEFLLQKDGTDYKPVICTSLMRVLYPGIITFYSSLFSNISHVSDASAIFFNQLSVDRVNVSPRIKMLNIILERQHWIINTDLIKLNQNDNVSQFTQIYSFLKENNIPTKFFIQGRKKEYNSLRITSVSVEFEKPQYIDLENMVWESLYSNMYQELLTAENETNTNKAFSISLSMQHRRFRSLSSFHKAAFSNANKDFFKKKEFQAYRMLVNFVYLLLPAMGLNSRKRVEASYLLVNTKEA